MERLIIVLPVPGLESDRRHWWLVSPEAVSASGAGDEWREQLSAVERVTAIAPAGSTRVTRRLLAGGSSPKQAASVARLTATDQSLGDRAALHVVSAASETGWVETAVVDNGVMLSWLGWAEASGLELASIIPAEALLPASDRWTAATFGSEHVLGRGEVLLPNEPELAELIAPRAELRLLEAAEVDAVLCAAAFSPPLDLRTGRFAARRGMTFDRGRVRELVLLAICIPLLTLAWALISIARMNADTDRLNRGTLARAEASLGHPVDLTSVENEMAQRAGAGGLLLPLTGLYQAMQPEPAVSTTTLGFTRDGTLAATIAGPSLDILNRVLLALQRSGYRVTAVPRQSSDGRAMIDLTVRAGA